MLQDRDETPDRGVEHPTGAIARAAPARVCSLARSAAAPCRGQGYGAPPRMRLTLTRPDDWHLHLRDGSAMAAVLPDTVRRFGRAIVMPNLKPPVTTVAAAAAYRDRIVAAAPAGSRFEPLLTLYL